MNLLGPISSIMSTNVVSLPPSASIEEANKIFSKLKIHHIPITEAGELVGMVSKSDFLFFQRGFIDNRQDAKVHSIRMKHYAVSQIMTKALATLEPSDKINVAIEIFKENLFHAIPICVNKQLKGIITTHDIINQLATNPEIEMSYE